MATDVGLLQAHYGAHTYKASCSLTLTDICKLNRAVWRLGRSRGGRQISSVSPNAIFNSVEDRESRAGRKRHFRSCELREREILSLADSDGIPFAFTSSVNLRRQLGASLDLLHREGVRIGITAEVPVPLRSFEVSLFSHLDNR
ncbi:hypothetical protein SAY87_031993 [Trapa incisa]|uniref:Uncharacterized protein n=1 Tax=Trapa incisa TaxID=236973 RepID=A0AAN7KQI1_9MYRT|nr:hypothetical protein SAY87_031993 [Trapa incisa]